MGRYTYDTSIKHLYRLGLIDCIPFELQKTIPRSNIHRWKNESNDKYFGFELNQIVKEELELIKQFSNSKKAKRLFSASVRIIETLKSIVDVKSIEKAFRSQKEQVVNLAHRIKDVISISRFVEIIGVSRSTFQNWSREIHVKCDQSFLFMCNKQFPLQASNKEVRTMKKMLTDSNFIYWPIASISAYCRREKILLLSDSSWYKYARLLGISRPKPNSRRKKKTKGIRASIPNEKWHADVSVFKINNIKYYIYLVVDNFSRRILSWRVSDKLNASIRVQTIRETYAKTTLLETDLNVDLIVDGGSENNNSLMDDFIESSEINIRKLVALRDIHFSNSLVEAHFSLIKYNYLYRMRINSLPDLHNSMERIVSDFNTIRPHHALNGSTPDEAYFNGKLMSKNQYLSRYVQTKTQRIRENKQNTCEGCE